MTSDLISGCQLSDSKDCPPVSVKPLHQKLTPRQAQIGSGLPIQRALPHRERRMIGAWCFFDHFGPLDLKIGNELDIAPHPHMGLQTFTWTLAGEILHRDSLGYEQLIRPGEVNLMTAGRGISHSEESITKGPLQGVQLWLALPDSARNNPPEFAHYSKLPVLEQDGLELTLLVGELFKQKAPTKTHTPLIGLNIEARQNATTLLPLNPNFEHGLMVLTGQMDFEGETLEAGNLLYLGCGRDHLPLRLPQGAQIFLIGGKPFEEEILLWWNFVARTKTEIQEAIQDWEKGTRFGVVQNYPGRRLAAPNL